MLEQYAAQYPAEAVVVERITQLVTNYADCFQRTCRPGHITGSAWVLSQDRSRLRWNCPPPSTGSCGMPGYSAAIVRRCRRAVPKKARFVPNSCMGVPQKVDI